MADGGGNSNVVWFTYTGQRVIPREVTHVIVSVRIVPRSAFDYHPNIVEVICREDVEEIGECAFRHCHSLRQIIMPGVTIVEGGALCGCDALEVVECGKLEIIGDGAFHDCISLRSIKLPSVRIVKEFAFYCCYALMEVKFGNKLERIERIERDPVDNPLFDIQSCAFCDCKSLERITIPLKDGLITTDDIFMTCRNLKHVDVVAETHQFVAALQLEGWRNDVKKEIDSINSILPSARAGYYDNITDDHGEKAQVMRRWIRSVLGKINHYKAEHDHLLNEAAATLQLVILRDVAMNGVLPFLALPLHEFEVEDESDEEEDLSEEAEDVHHGEEAEDDGGVSEEDEDDDQEDDQKRHLFCCLRKLWSCPMRTFFMSS